jgi:putative endonuclease
MYFVYVIRSESVGRIYIGHTGDLEKRLGEHNDPSCFSSKFTKRVPGPWSLIYNEKYSTRSEAFRRERWLKTGCGRDFLKSLPGLGWDGQFSLESTRTATSVLAHDTPE